MPLPSIQLSKVPSCIRAVSIGRGRRSLRVVIYCTFLGWMLLKLGLGYAQSTSYQQLEKKVFDLNNALKFNESQALLLPVLQSGQYSADEKYHAAILLSYTYKRLQDYQSTVSFLEKAREFARQTPRKEAYLASIMAQEALSHFDIHNYKKSDSLMKVLERTGFRYIDLENKSKLVMQQGYLLFMDKQYPQSEATYDRAIRWMQLAAPCDLPMIYVKKMELYNAMHKPELLREAFLLSGEYADSCGIIKYQIYAHEQLLRIYESHNDPTAVAISRALDSLNLVYAQTQNLAALHNQKELMLLSEKDQKLQSEQRHGQHLTFGLMGLGLLAIALLIWAALYRRKKIRLEVEFEGMKSELEAYLSKKQKATYQKTQEGNTLSTGGEGASVQPAEANLSERQREVLDYLAAGKSNREIADQLFISENTVKYHIRNIYQILGIKDRKDLLVKFRK